MTSLIGNVIFVRIRVRIRVRNMDAVYEDETGTGNSAIDDVKDDVTYGVTIGN